MLTTLVVFLLAFIAYELYVIQGQLDAMRADPLLKRLLRQVSIMRQIAADEKNRLDPHWSDRVEPADYSGEETTQ